MKNLGYLMKEIAVLHFFLCAIPCSLFAQFHGDEVLLYVKAGENPVSSNNVFVISYFSRRDEIRQVTSSSTQIRNALRNNPEYFESPYNIPEHGCSLYTSYRSPKQFCQHDVAASTSKYIVFSASAKGYYDSWGYHEPCEVFFAVSKDKIELLVWNRGKESQRTTYILAPPTAFEQKTNYHESFDFLE